jgi:N utilization substance protein B
MLNRRVLRVRVLQFLYSYYSLLKFNDEPKQLKGDFVRKISNSLQEINKYYYKYLSIAIFLSDVNNEKREIAKSEKIKKSESRFNLSGNKVIDFLRKNKQFIDNLIRYDISWSSKSEEIRNWYNLILGEEITKNYLLLSNPDFNDDFEYVKKLVNKILFKNEDIILYFENQNIHWSDDRLIIRSMIKKTIESLNSPNFNTFAFANLSEDIKDDINFASSLFDSTVDNTSEYDEYIIKNSKNWKLDRISLMDKSILRMGIDEMIHFPNIPIKVTMNECIDIAKDYSTPKSGLFINGVLDVISLNLQKKGIIKKSGKGLIDNK